MCSSDLISAMLQSHQTWLPILQEPMTFEKLILNHNYESKFIAHCEENENKNLLSKIEKKNTSVLLIGPEGDFTPEEIENAINKSFVPVSLGENRLRTETAGIVGVTLMNF